MSGHSLIYAIANFLMMMSSIKSEMEWINFNYMSEAAACGPWTLWMQSIPKISKRQENFHSVIG